MALDEVKNQEALQPFHRRPDVVGQAGHQVGGDDPSRDHHRGGSEMKTHRIFDLIQLNCF
jgi:hypothetical protein